MDEYVWMRGNMQVDTETAGPPEKALADLTRAHFLATCTIPLYLRSCKRCKGAKPADKEFCASCQQKEWDEDAEYRAEERARRYYEANRMR